MMVDKEVERKKKEEKEKEKEKKESALENPATYRLVVIMLFILGILALSLIFLPLCLLLLLPPSNSSAAYLDYYKWALSVLLGTFGAWIGAGAAYFFGKENLLESSRSTESAMKIQRESFRSPPVFERIKDMTLTTMNANFLFDLKKTKKEVVHQLAKFKGYWFVPVVEPHTGILQDIIHAQVFWAEKPFKEDDSLEEMVSKMDDHPSLKKLHGDSFYARISLNDKISEVYAQMDQKDAEVAIVVDEKGKASHCLTKTELRTFLKVPD